MGLELRAELPGRDATEGDNNMRKGEADSHKHTVRVSGNGSMEKQEKGKQR
jgi:hypothetical protein